MAGVLLIEWVMDRLDLKLGFRCNNRCRFCVQGDKRNRYEPRAPKRIADDLAEGRSRGAKALVLTGGEPTIHKTLLQTIRLAQTMGYTTIQIQSNGRRFFYEDYCRELIDAGVTEFSPALHGSDAKIHDGLTRVPGSFAQTLQGIRHLKRLGAYVLTNSVITSANYKDLPELATLLVQTKVDQFQLAYVHILGEADLNKEGLVVEKSKALPYIHRALDIGRAAGVRCYTEAIPYCFMQGYEDCVAEAIIPRTMVCDAEAVIEDYTQYRHTEGKTKGPNCSNCSRYNVCEGPWKEYVDLFGWKEFIPVREGKAAAK